ncbi:MAG: hypothetical protein J0H94_09270 [Rhizobiales bacterium]|nr:hypothetical protein [Hyphomicrobiales bacterium]
MTNESTPQRDTDEAIDVRITISRSAYERAREIVFEDDAEICPLLRSEGPTTVEDYIAWLIEDRLR